MKRLNNKSGFTLVECVVAMAVLAIMSLLLMMILTSTINARNANQKLEKDIDSQVDKIVGTGAITTEYKSEIVFSYPNGAGGTFTESIPADNDDGVKAKKRYDSTAEAALGALQYDFSEYEKFKDIKNGIGSTPTVTTSKNIYGSEGNEVKITENAINRSGEKEVTWTVGYNSANPGAKEISVKIILPAGWHDVSFSGTSAGKMLMIDANTVRIESGDASVNAAITFQISDEDYAAYGSLDKYFKNGAGTGNTITINL